ncbi:MAG TPA: rhomboid family intramembrane serine protease [Candidatus Binataceae bacterium]|nr:rhomboid family intramembrane serine protease [Candidatus Binataceae bacterium]
MIPLRDSEAEHRLTPVNSLLIVANVAVFAIEIRLGPHAVRVFERFAMVPASIAREQSAALITLITALFLHAGFAHIAGNMLYLFIFGPAIEERMGRRRYLVFYLLAGIIAGLAMVAMGPESRIPVVGASGAIAGVLGAYLALFPGGRITAVVPFLFFIRVLEIPAIFFLIVWFALQLYSGIASGSGPLIGGIAWWAHVGGFLFGLALGPLLARRKPPRRRR